MYSLKKLLKKKENYFKINKAKKQKQNRISDGSLNILKQRSKC